MNPQKLIGYLIVLALTVWLGFAVYTVIEGHGHLPPAILEIFYRNYLIVVVFPVWAIGCWVFVLAFDAFNKNTFNVELGGLKFQGSGGLVVA